MKVNVDVNVNVNLNVNLEKIECASECDCECHATSFDGRLLDVAAASSERSSKTYSEPEAVRS